MSIGIIYRARNKLNNKVYIGQTTQGLLVRKQGHEYSAKRYNTKGSTYFENALRKYGFENFEWSILCECYNNQTELNICENIFISYYNSMQHSKGYNLREGGSTGKLSSTTIQKMRESLRKRIIPSSTCENIRKGVTKMWKNPTHRKIRIKSSKQSHNTLNYRQKISGIAKIVQNRPEVKEKNRAGVTRAHLTMLHPRLKMTIILAENPHLVLQGEGRNIGQKQILIRVYKCNVQCPACDSSHTWREEDTSFKREVSIPDLAKELQEISDKFQVHHIMITGGEPQIYREQLNMLMTQLGSKFQYDIETTGQQDWEVTRTHWDRVYFDFSPKIGKLEAGNRIREYRGLRNLPSNYSIKVVVSVDSWDDNLREIQEFQQEYSIPNKNVFLMPFGITRETMLLQTPFILEKAFQYGYNFSPRMHILMFDTKRLV